MLFAEILMMDQKKVRASSECLSSASSDDESISSSATSLFDLSPDKLHEELAPHKLSLDALQENGYPMWDEITQTVYFEQSRLNRSDWFANDDFLRKCARCNKPVVLNHDGSLNSKPCRYHYRPKWDPVSNTKLLHCCYTTPGTSKGCRRENSHVFYGAWEDTLLDFVTTPTASSDSDFRSKKVYALDVETVFTLNGMECGRVSLVDHKGTVTVDVTVLPAYPIIDFNYDFSGLSMADMHNAISLEDCRRRLFEFINKDTLLIGHSLESDLKALRLVHENVLDTSILFAAQKRSGKQTKLSLKNLAAAHLGKVIQGGAVGHSSVEDAAICMELLSKFHADNRQIIEKETLKTD
uniref:Exonuclease domain-containing protein n=1 Tax=Caenorhabditis japonica TaxID=281687 RepID=A0A8R1E0D9_CAEJA